MSFKYNFANRRIKRYLLLYFYLAYLPFAYATPHFEYADWATLLKKHVSLKEAESSVDYELLRKNKESLLSFTSRISAVSEKDFLTWSKSDQLAFLINAYNAFTLQLLVTNEPVASIKKLGDLFSSPWKKKFYFLFGEKRHLDWLEHEKIRKHYPEPRIHFAVNCASKGCPALLPEPFLGGKLEQQLEQATILFLNDKKRNYYDPKKGILSLSKIFDWYQIDFQQSGKTVLDFVLPRLKLSPAEKLEITNKTVKIEYLEYNWKLNQK